jgi:hypothetical protein
VACFLQAKDHRTATTYYPTTAGGTAIEMEARDARRGVAMTISVIRHGVNRPAVAVMWGLTLIALVPLPTVYLILGAAVSLAANVIAVALLLSRSVADRWHGVARLLLQVGILAAGTVIVMRSGIGVDGLLKFVLRQAH